MAEREIAYLEMRAASEVQMAQQAKCREAMTAHEKLAQAYLNSAQALRRHAAAPHH